MAHGRMSFIYCSNTSYSLGVLILYVPFGFACWSANFWLVHIRNILKFYWNWWIVGGNIELHLSFFLLFSSYEHIICDEHKVRIVPIWLTNTRKAQFFRTIICMILGWGLSSNWLHLFGRNWKQSVYNLSITDLRVKFALNPLLPIAHIRTIYSSCRCRMEVLFHA